MSAEKILTLKFEVIHCSDCAHKIEQHLLHFPGIKDVNLLQKNKRVHITLETQPATSGDILKSLRALGFPAEVTMLDDTVGISEHGEQESFFRIFRKRLLRIQLLTGVVLSSLLFALTVLQYFFDWSWINPVSLVLTIPILLWVSFPLLRGFLYGPNKFDLLIYLTGFALFCLSIANEFFFGGSVFYFLVALIFTITLASKYVEKRARTQALVFEKHLSSVIPRRAKYVAPDGTKRYVPLSRVRVGDSIEIRSQDFIPADGVIVAGNSTVDESFLAGESLPQERGVGSFILAGSLNQSGTITMQISAIGEKTVLAQMIASLRSARRSVSHIQRLLDRIAWVMLPVILLVAAGTFLGWYFGGVSFADSLRTASAVLLAASPYTLSRVSGLAYGLALQKAATRGVFFKNEDNLEQLPRVQKAIFELYPTLTQKNIEVTDIIGGDRFKIMQMVGSLEAQSSTPIGQALVTKATSEGVTLSRRIKDVYEYPGRGLEGTVDGRTLLVGTPEFVAEQHIDFSEFAPQLNEFAAAGKIPLIATTRKELIGVIALRFVPSSTSVKVLAQLKELGIRTFLLSGHYEPSLQTLARELTIQTVLHEIRDDLRVSVVTGLAKTRGLLLAATASVRSKVFERAHIGVIMKDRESLSFEGSDILLTRFGLKRLPVAFSLARQTRKVISQNILWSFFYNVVAVTLAFTNVITPELAIIFSALSPLIIIVSSLRLKNDIKNTKQKRSRRAGKVFSLPRTF